MSVRKGSANTLIDCCLFNVQRQIFHASSGREYLQQYIIKRKKDIKKKRKEINKVQLGGGNRDNSFWLPLEKWRMGYGAAKFSFLQRHGAYSFSKSAEGFFYVQGAWHSPNTLPTMVRMVRPFRIIIWQAPVRRSPLSATWGRAG